WQRHLQSDVDRHPLGSVRWSPADTARHVVAHVPPRTMFGPPVRTDDNQCAHRDTSGRSVSAGVLAPPMPAGTPARALMALSAASTPVARSASSRSDGDVFMDGFSA